MVESVEPPHTKNKRLIKEKDKERDKIFISKVR
jgi:hypothetical protein